MPSYRHDIKPQPNEVIKPVIQEREKEYQHAIVRSEQLSLAPIISHISGSSWVVDYYAQMLGSDGEPVPYDKEATFLNQQYHLIYNLEMKLQSQDRDNDDVTNRVGATGTAVIFTGIIPNYGDVIIADVGSGMAGRLTVKKVTKMTYMKNTVYEIDYELIEFINKEVIDRIDRYVVKKSVFNGDLIPYGNDPVIASEDYDVYLNAEDVKAELIDDYLKEFFSIELSTFVVPEYGEPTYDPYVIEAFKEVVNVDEHPLMRKLKSLNVNEIKEAYPLSIWKALIDPSVNRINNSWRRAGPVSHQLFNINPVLNSFRYSGFKACISPVENLLNVDFYNGWNKLTKVGNIASMSRFGGLVTGAYGGVIGNQLLEAMSKSNKACCHHLVYYHNAHPGVSPLNSATWLDTVNLWIRATGHDSCHFCSSCSECCSCDKDGKANGDNEDTDDKYFYVLSPSFWKDKTLDDPFHSMVRRHLNRQKVDLKEIVDYISNRMSLTPKQRFYRMMVMLILLISNMRGI